MLPNISFEYEFDRLLHTAPLISVCIFTEKPIIKDLEKKL